MLGWLVHEHGIEPHVTVFDKSARKDGTFSREDFTYDPAGDIYFCPGGKTLTTTGTLRERWRDAALSREQDRLRRLRFEAALLSEDVRPARCRAPSTRALATWRAQIAKSWEGRVSRRLRKKVEMLFAHLKRILKLDRLRLRGPTGARDEFILAATAQNLRKLTKLIPIPSPMAA